jgi:hypothetical protein
VVFLAPNKLSLTVIESGMLAHVRRALPATFVRPLNAKAAKNEDFVRNTTNKVQMDHYSTK